MANLTHITFTGIDEQTDINRIVDIQMRYPKAEFGMLMCMETVKHPNRFLDPESKTAYNTYKAASQKLRLSAHLCGMLALDAAEGNWKTVMQYCPSFGAFLRCQLNLTRLPYTPDIIDTDNMPDTLSELIIQQKNTDNCCRFLTIKDKSRISVLLDASGGHGIFTAPTPLSGPYHVGYAGGLDSHNVSGFVKSLMNDPRVGDFWIDMETGVRTNDWLDLDKVEAVLKAVYDIL